MFLNKKSEFVLLKELKLNQDENCKVKLVGERAGILIWILSMLGLAHINYELSIMKDKVEITAGRTRTILPLKDLHDFNGGYKNIKWLLIGSIFTGIFGSLYSLMALSAIFDYGDFSPFFFMTFFTVLITYVLFWLYKNSGRLYIELNAFNGLSYALFVKSGSGTVQGGDSVTFDSMRKIIDTIIELANENSEHYSKK